ncbi:MAG: MFS transporter, partial [Planctomycetia bacterium]|nr:MFS transporter [Planctomycetia bacterium]
LTVFIDLLGFGIVLPVMPRQAEPYLAALGLSPLGIGAMIGVLFSVFSLMQFVFSPLWGRLSDRVGRRPMLLLSLLGSVVFYAVYGYAVTFPPERAAWALGSPTAPPRRTARGAWPSSASRSARASRSDR